MATQDLTHGTAGAPYARHQDPRFFLVENVIDFSADNAASADVIQALHITAPSFVLFAGLEVQTLEGGTATGDLGDGDNADGYLDGVDLNGTAGDLYVSANATARSTTNANVQDTGGAAELYSILGGNLYTGDDTLDLTCNNALDAAIVRIFMATIWLHRRNAD